MTDSALPPTVRRELTILKAYAVLSALAIAGLGYVVLGGAAPTSFDEIDVRRINVRHESGLLALAIAGEGRLPGPTFEGREYAQELSGGRTTNSGMIFFNEKGDEVGGLTYQGRRTDDGFVSSGGITFDQFEQDQVVSLSQSTSSAARSAGLNVWDRGTQVSIGRILELVEARRTETGAALDSVNAVIAGLAEAGALGTHRIFLGSRNRTASLTIEDTSGRPRIRMLVDSLDVARLEFLDEAGTVVRTFRP
jgi:hypothetical protein